MGSIKHDGDVTVYDSQHIRGINGGRQYTRAPQIMDHFTGIATINSSVPQNWVTTETGAATPFAVASGTAGGVAIAVTGGTTNNGQELAGKNVMWTPSTMATKTKLVLEVRAKFVAATTATSGDFAIGFGDAVTYANSLPYVVSAASALTTHVPTEFCGFYYSSIPTSGALFLSGGNPIGAVSSKADVDTVTAGTKVKDSNFHVYRLEMDSSSNAQFFIDDVHQFSIAAATTASVALTPYIGVVCKASHAQTATVDYIFVGGDLV